MRTNLARQGLRRVAVVTISLAMGFGLFTQPGSAAPSDPIAATSTAPATSTSTSTPSSVPGPSAGTAPSAPADQLPHTQGKPLPVPDRPPLSASASATARRDYDDPSAAVLPARPSMAAEQRVAAAATCTVADFASRTGAALVQQIKASTTDCVNTLFSVTGPDAYSIFREAQMTTVAYALRDLAGTYPGNGSTGAPQVVLFLRAGYYVHWYNQSTVGTYGPTLQTAIRSGLDAFYANPHSSDVTDANGETLAEAVTLIDSAEQNARYLYVVKRLLAGYNSSYDASWWMKAAVNNSFTVLFRGHQVPEFVTTVQADPSIVDAVDAFATAHRDLLGTDRGYLTTNAGRELVRFVQYPTLQAKVRPKVRTHLQATSITGPTASLWVALAEGTDFYDKAQCAYYDTCNLQARLTAAVLTVDYTCSAGIRIRAQEMTAANLTAACTSLRNQDAYFHGVVADNGPVANDRNSTIEVVVFDSSDDYQTYAGAIFGIDTNNGGMYLEGDPSAAGNQPRFIAYEAEWTRPAFEIWNLNHEYTHYLDGRFDMAGDFDAGVTTPTIWWIEGFAEYVSYSYRNLPYDAAITEAGKHTYALSTVFDTTYSHDTTRIYRWGYLGVRYMLQKHPADITRLLGYYRAGDWTGARSFLTSTIGTRYDSDWYTWLAACAAGDCGGGTPANRPPVAEFTSAVNGTSVAFTDTSTDPDGTIASRAWDFGDGTTSTAANPTRNYAAGTYTVRLTVTDNRGATANVTHTVTVTGGGGGPECTDPDTRVLGKNCRRSGLSAAAGGNDKLYFYIYIPAGTARLNITTAGGTGNADLYYNSDVWATNTAYTSKSTATGNAETLTITAPPEGYHYITLHAKQTFAGTSVTTAY
ncbi:collagenase [Embleya sp. NPDC008237]|uniref:collagenase n=1 Tax=Embleya sp. NPDC008237 TaxID=3363978 RepID=UPI0036F13924